QHVDVVIEQSRHGNLLLVAARERADVLVWSGAPHGQAVDPLTRRGGLPPRPDHGPWPEPVELREREVLGHAETGREPFTCTVLAHHAHALLPPCAVDGRTAVNTHTDAPGPDRLEAEDRSQQS